jgi:hypothetical protein
MINIEKIENRERGYLMNRFRDSLIGIKRYIGLWTNYKSYIQIFRFSLYLEDIGKSEDQVDDETYIKICRDFVKGLLLLPVKLLQYNSTKEHISNIYNDLLNTITNTDTQDLKGVLFEAAFLLSKIMKKNGKYQFYLNDTVIIDPTKAKDKQDDNEFDLIEFLINDSDKVECWIYECSISDSYMQTNKEKLARLADNINSIFPNLIIRTRYVIPNDKSKEDWTPREEDTGRNYY